MEVRNLADDRGRPWNVATRVLTAKIAIETAVGELCDAFWNFPEQGADGGDK